MKVRDWLIDNVPGLVIATIIFALFFFWLIGLMNIH